MNPPAENHIIAEEVKSFLIDRRARQLSHRTIDFYSYHLDLLLTACKESGLGFMTDITASFLRQILGDFGETHNKGGVHCYYRCLKAFCIWYEKETDGEWKNPIHKVTPPKIKQDPIPGVSIDDVKRLVAACGKDWCGKRDRALFLFLFDTGLRRNECFDLNLEDIDIQTGTVQVKNGKGDKDRVVYFGQDTTMELRRYLRGRSNDPGSSPLWLTRSKNRMNDSALRDMLVRRCADCGMEEIPSAHDFRRGFALNMLRNGADLLSVSRLLGHESLEVTKRYLALVEEDLERAHAAASPVDRMKQRKSK